MCGASVRDPWQGEKVPRPRFWLQRRLTFIENLPSWTPLSGLSSGMAFQRFAALFLSPRCSFHHAMTGARTETNTGARTETRRGSGVGSLLATMPFFRSPLTSGFGGPWLSEPEVRAEDLPHALPVQAVPDGDLFERQSLHGTQPEHVVLARLWRMAADRLDPDVQTDRLHDQQSHLQGDRAVARFEARKDGGLYARQARDTLAAEPPLAASLLNDVAKLGRGIDG